MSAEIFKFKGDTTHDFSPDQVLSQSLGKLDKVLVIGIDAEGAFYADSSCGTIPDALFLLECCKIKLMRNSV